MPEFDEGDEMRIAWREQFRLDALASWEHYKATGLHVTGEEMDAWMATLEAGENAEPPKAHL